MELWKIFRLCFSPLAFLAFTEVLEVYFISWDFEIFWNYERYSDFVFPHWHFWNFRHFWRFTSKARTLNFLELWKIFRLCFCPLEFLAFAEVLEVYFISLDLETFWPLKYFQSFFWVAYLEFSAFLEVYFISLDFKNFWNFERYSDFVFPHWHFWHLRKFWRFPS